MESFALVDRSRPTVREQILMLVDDRRAADEMAWELRRQGHAVDVREVGDDVGVRRSWERPPATSGWPRSVQRCFALFVHRGRVEPRDPVRRGARPTRAPADSEWRDGGDGVVRLREIVAVKRTAPRE